MGAFADDLRQGLSYAASFERPFACTTGEQQQL